MEHGRLPGAAAPVSRCVFGASGVRDSSKFALLDAYVQAGGNCLDTARVYGGGASERAVGEWLRRTRPDRLVIIAKGAHPPNCTPQAVATELDVTLETLGVDRVELYLLHRDDPAVPAGEFVDALQAEVAAGRIGAYGGSNWTAGRLAEANAYASAHGHDGMVAVSNHFSLAEPDEPLYPGCEATPPELRGYLTETGGCLIPWSSQARGFFADVPKESLDPNVWRCWGSAANYARRDRARALAERLDVLTINIALAYVLAQPFATFPIIGPQTAGELAIALRGADLRLDAGQLRWLELGAGVEYAAR
ncbi:MAG TPA: aldo/keto reductase [Pseudonocardiaceae bacterium]|nr:aldo/keto reductase [Pseudonocardiaceae bacterium]